MERSGFFPTIEEQRWAVEQILIGMARRDTEQRKGDVWVVELRQMPIGVVFCLETVTIITVLGTKDRYWR